MSDAVFKYDNCLERPFDDAAKVIRRVNFLISRYGKHEETINFKEPVSEASAIKAVEKWFNEPVTNDHWTRVQDDLFHSDREIYKIRGDCLGDCIFIETMYIQQGELSFICGS